MTRFARLAPLTLTALLAGCGSSTSTSSSSGASPAPAATSASTAASTPASTPPAASHLTFTETQFKITPASAALTKTGTVAITVKNTGTVTHALEVESPAGAKRTAPIAPGATATLTVDVSKAGRYTFFCPIDHHRMLGMQGVLIVGAGAAARGSGSAATTGATTPSSSGSGSSSGSSGSSTGGGYKTSGY